MNSNNKYLTQINGMWYIRIRAPKSWNYPKERFTCCLGTSDLKIARKSRDRYLLPILAETKASEILNEIGHLIYSSTERTAKLRENMEAQFPHKPDITIKDLFNERVNFLKNSGARLSTVRNYKETADTFALLLGNIPLKKITLTMMRNCRTHYQKLPSTWRRGLFPKKSDKAAIKLVASSTIRNRFKTFESTWNWAITEGITKYPYPAQGLKIRTRSDETSQTQPMTAEECALLLNIPCPRTKSFTKEEWQLFPLIAKFTGMRLSEIAQLRTEDIIRHQNVLCFDINDNGNKNLKTKSSRRIIPIAEKLLPHIKKYIEGKSGALFNIGGSRPGKKIGDIFNRKAKAIGTHLHFHSFRGFFITALANAGTAQSDRMRLAGHKASVHGGYTADDMWRFKKAVDSID